MPKSFAIISQVSLRVLKIFRNVELAIIVLKQMVFPLKKNEYFPENTWSPTKTSTILDYIYLHLFSPEPLSNITHYLNFQSSNMTKVTVLVSPGGDHLLLISNSTLACNTTICQSLFGKISKKASE